MERGDSFYGWLGDEGPPVTEPRFPAVSCCVCLCNFRCREGLFTLTMPRDSAIFCRSSWYIFWVHTNASRNFNLIRQAVKKKTTVIFKWLRMMHASPSHIVNYNHTFMSRYLNMIFRRSISSLTTWNWMDKSSTNLYCMFWMKSSRDPPSSTYRTAMFLGEHRTNQRNNHVKMKYGRGRRNDWQKFNCTFEGLECISSRFGSRIGGTRCILK